MNRPSLAFLTLLIPLACGETTNNGDDGANHGGDTSSERTGGAPSSGGGPLNGGELPGTGGYRFGEGPACDAWREHRVDIEDPYECRFQGEACGIGGAIAEPPCERVVVEFDPPITPSAGVLEVTTDVDVTVGIGDYPCGADTCALPLPSAENIESLTLQWLLVTASSTPFPTRVTLALKDESSGNVIVSKTSELDFACRTVDYSAEWCWNAAPVAVDLSVTDNQGGSGP